MAPLGPCEAQPPAAPNRPPASDVRPLASAAAAGSKELDSSGSSLWGSCSASSYSGRASFATGPPGLLGHHLCCSMGELPVGSPATGGGACMAAFPASAPRAWVGLSRQVVLAASARQMEDLPSLAWLCSSVLSGVMLLAAWREVPNRVCPGLSAPRSSDRVHRRVDIRCHQQTVCTALDRGSEDGQPWGCTCSLPAYLCLKMALGYCICSQWDWQQACQLSAI